jgi:glycosyltransferase involved in cell wall biosynthesis
MKGCTSLPESSQSLDVEGTHKWNFDNQALRVCFISHQYPPGMVGGIGRFTADLAAGFAANGHDVHVLTSHGGVSGVSVEDGVWLHRLVSQPVVPKEIVHEAAGLFLTRMFMVYREVLRLHGEKPFDIISDPIWLAEGLAVALDSRLTSVLSLHTSSKTGVALSATDRSAPGDPLPILEMHTVRAHRHTHANSKAAVEKIEAEYSETNNVFVIPHGVTDQSSAFRRNRNEENRVRVLTVGLLEKRKGADVLYEIIPKILSNFADVEFILVGPAFPMPELGNNTLPVAIQKKFAKKPNILQRAHFAGVVPDNELYQAYANADLLILPSRYESFGLSVVEAMSFGLPVVAWKAGGVAETVVDGETGILVPVEDRQGLIEAVGRLVTDRQLRLRYGANARQRYLSNFSTSISVPRTISAYRDIAEMAKASADSSRSFQAEAFNSRIADIVEKVTALRGESALAIARRLSAGDGLSEPVEVAKPRVGVIVICSNADGSVTAALESVLAQTYSNFACVVVDDASSDQSFNVISNWISERKDDRFSLVRNQANEGQMACIAVGIAACDADLIACLNDDESWSSDFLQIHARVIYGTSIWVSRSDEPSREILQDASRSFGAGGDFAQPWPSVTLVPAHVEVALALDSSMMFQKSFLNIVMPLDRESFRTDAQQYIFRACHYLSGSFAIDRRLLTSYEAEGRSASAAFGATVRAGFDRVREQIFLRGLLRHLLDNPPALAAVLSGRRRQVLVRRLVRKCFLAGVSVEDGRIYDVVGFSRILRDKFRSRVSFLRSSLA